MAMLPPEPILNWLWYVPRFPLEPLRSTDPAALGPTCPTCSSPATRTERGSGPHYARLSCAACGRWLRWLPWSDDIVFEPTEPNTVQAELFDATSQRPAQYTVPSLSSRPQSRIDFQALNSQLRARDVIALLGMRVFSLLGNCWRGQCPIHGSTSPTSRSMHVDCGLRKFYCHKCHAKGDLIDLYAQTRGIGVFAAATELARHFCPEPGRE